MISNLSLPHIIMSELQAPAMQNSKVAPSSRSPRILLLDGSLRKRSF